MSGWDLSNIAFFHRQIKPITFQQKVRKGSKKLIDIQICKVLYFSEPQKSFFSGNLKKSFFSGFECFDASFQSF